MRKKEKKKTQFRLVKRERKIDKIHNTLYSTGRGKEIKEETKNGTNGWGQRKQMTIERQQDAAFCAQQAIKIMNKMGEINKNE